jgi:beta-lactam-binding protein with PASTA domain
MKFIYFLLTPQFRKHFLFAILLIVVLVFGLIASLSIFTKHGEVYKLPNLVGLTVPQAESITKVADIRFSIDTVYVEGKTPGIILQQDPDGGLDVKIGRMVYLLVQANQPPLVYLPSLKDKTLTEVRAILRSYGLKVGAQIYKPDIALDVILDAEYKDKSIQPNQGIPRGEAIDLILGDGFGTLMIPTPNLVGLTLQEAIFSLRGNGLLLGKVKNDGDLPDSEAKVYIQYPSSVDRDSLETGSQINIFLQ